MNMPKRACRHQAIRWSCVFIDSRHQARSGDSWSILSSELMELSRLLVCGERGAGAGGGVGAGSVAVAAVVASVSRGQVSRADECMRYLRAHAPRLARPIEHTFVKRESQS